LHIVLKHDAAPVTHIVNIELAAPNSEDSPHVNHVLCAVKGDLEENQVLGGGDQNGSLLKRHGHCPPKNLILQGQNR